MPRLLKVGGRRLKLDRTQHRVNVAELLKHARVCRVEKAMKPYLEATV
jgi:hypothetical protein